MDTAKNNRELAAFFRKRLSKHKKKVLTVLSKLEREVLSRRLKGSSLTDVTSALWKKGIGTSFRSPQPRPYSTTRIGQIEARAIQKLRDQIRLLGRNI